MIPLITPGCAHEGRVGVRAARCGVCCMHVQGGPQSHPDVGKPAVHGRVQVAYCTGGVSTPLDFPRWFFEAVRVGSDVWREPLHWSGSRIVSLLAVVVARLGF